MKIISKLFDGVRWYVGIDEKTGERLTPWVKDKTLIAQ